MTLQSDPSPKAPNRNAAADTLNHSSHHLRFGAASAGKSAGGK